MVWVLVERAGVHYLLASYTAGLILAVAGFFVSKLWIFAQLKG